jgi:hypothetical protein
MGPGQTGEVLEYDTNAIILRCRLFQLLRDVHPVLLILVKALIGGSVVVAFAVLGEMLRPRGLAGVFAAAPSVAIAGLAISSLTTGSPAAAVQASGMIVGAAALSVSCLVGTEAVKRLGAMRGSVGVVITWVLVGLGAWTLMLR